MDKIHEIFKQNTRARAEQLGLRGFQVAEKAGMKPSQFSYYLSEKNPTVPSIVAVERIARALETTAADLLADPAAQEPLRISNPALTPDLIYILNRLPARLVNQIRPIIETFARLEGISAQDEENKKLG